MTTALAKPETALALPLRNGNNLPATVSHDPSGLDLLTLGRACAQSGFFADSRQEAQAVVKILAGRELGFGPIASMTGIYIVKGRVTLSANLIAAAVRRHPEYDYRIAEHSETVCEVEFLRLGKPMGRSRFSMEDARKAGLGGDNWKGYARNMLFARAMSNGAKWHCPDVFNGAPVYTPEELGALVDGATGEIIETQGRTVNEATGEVTEPAARVSRAAEQEPSYAGASGLAVPTVASVRERCTKLMSEIGVPAADLSKPKGYLQRALGRDIGKFSDLGIEDWQEIEGALGVTLDTKRAAFGAYGEWCRREGHDKGDRDFRLSTWGEIIGHAIETTGNLTQPEFAKVAETLTAAAHELDGTTPETALPYDDPFEE